MKAIEGGVEIIKSGYNKGYWVLQLEETKVDYEMKNYIQL